MSYRLVIAEKPSVGVAYAKVLGATNRQDGYWEGNGYLVSWCMNRYVRRGSKGIALLDESGGYPRLHYVFDVSDTALRRNALYPDLWQINESLKEPVRSMLAENYDVHSESFGQQLADVAGKLVQSYRDNNSSDILGIVDGSYFLPNLTLNQPRKQLNRYGRMRRNYLMEQRPVVYSTMLLNGTLYPHLWEVEQTAENRMQQLMKELLERNPAPDKEKKQMAWVQHVNSLKAQAEEMILTELIYS